MKTIAVIAEFNPFHKGHEYFINRTKELSGADNMVCIMSGNHVQRGEPALWDKFTRTRAALLSGADMVLELPLSFSTGSAQIFAHGAVSVLDSLNCIDELWFGSESGDEKLFDAVSDALKNESEFFSRVIKEELKKGTVYPKARQAALCADLKERNADIPEKSVNELISSPNNILGIEYCLALKELNSAIVPKTLKRKGAGYNDLSTDTLFSSASAIRNAALTGDRTAALSSLPEVYSKHFDTKELISSCVFPDDYSLILKYKLLCESIESLQEYLEINEDLARRIKANENHLQSFSQFAMLLKTKNLTYSHVKRCLLHIVLNVKKEDLEKDKQRDFVRVLGFRKECSLMHDIKKGSGTTLVSKPSSVFTSSYEREAFASNVYYSLLSEKTKQPFTHEYSRKIVII